MSDGGVSVQVASDDRVSAGLKKIALSFDAKKLASVLDEIGASNVTETQDRFEKESDPGGQKWHELSDETKARRRARGQTTIHILNDRRDLFDSITHKVHLTGVAVGTNRVYGRVHQEGWAERKIPARPYLGVSKEGQKEILQIVQDHLEGK